MSLRPPPAAVKLRAQSETRAGRSHPLRTWVLGAALLGCQPVSVERAVSLYERARQRRGNSAEAAWRLAALRIEAGDDEAAATLVRSVQAETLLGPEAALRLAKAESSRGRSERAREKLDAARAENPNHAALRDALAELQAASTDPAPDPERGSTP